MAMIISRNLKEEQRILDTAKSTEVKPAAQQALHDIYYYIYYDIYLQNMKIVTHIKQRVIFAAGGHGVVINHAGGETKTGRQSERAERQCSGRCVCLAVLVKGH